MPNFGILTVALEQRIETHASCLCHRVVIVVVVTMLRD
jgi:hypothetical protein